MEIKRIFAQEGVKYHTDRRDFVPREAREWRKVPMDRLKNRLQITAYDKHAFLIDGEFIHPPEVQVMLKQHIGTPAVPIVDIGEKVEEGQVIAKVSKDKLGACIHASICGKVIHIDEQKIVIRGGESS